MDLENIILSEISQSEKENSYVESDEQTELTSKTDRLTGGEQADSSGERGWGVEGSSKKKKKKLMDMDNSVVIVGGRGCVEVEEGIRGINGNGKKYNKRIRFFFIF